MAMSVRGGRFRVPAMVFASVLALAAAGCNTTTQHGYVMSDMALEQVPVGSSKDQVLIALGSPSTTGNYGGEVFYYISQTRKQTAAFTSPKVVNQRVLAVYFDKNEKVARLGNYGLKDGKVFDFVTQTTPTSGLDQSFLAGVLGGVLKMGGPFTGSN